MAVSYNRQYEGRASCVPAVRFCDSNRASYADELRRTQGQTAKICPTSCLTPRSGDGARPCRGSTTRVWLLAKFADGDARVRRPYAPQGLHRCTPSLVDEDATTQRTGPSCPGRVPERPSRRSKCWRVGVDAAYASERPADRYAKERRSSAAARMFELRSRSGCHSADVPSLQ